MMKFLGGFLILVALVAFYLLGWPLVRSPQGKEVKLGPAAFIYYEKPGALSTVIIVPPSGGLNFGDKIFASDLWYEGHEVIVMRTWEGLETQQGIDLGLHDRYYRAFTRALGTILSSVTTPKVGLFGMSGGGLYTQVGVAVAPRINAALSITGGIPLYKIIVHSDQKAMRDLKQKRAFKSGEEYERALVDKIEMEPAKLRQDYTGVKLGVILSESDTTVPASTQYALRDFWKAEVLKSHTRGHMYAILWTYVFDRRLILDFFRSLSTAP